MLNSDFLKGAIDAGNKLIGILDKIVDFSGMLPTLATGLAGVLSFKSNTGKLFCFEYALHTREIHISMVGM